MANLPHWYTSRVKIHYFREKTDFYMVYITKSKPKIRKRVNARKNFERWLLETYCLDFPNSKRTSALVLHYKGSHIRLCQLAFSQLLNQSGINRLNSTIFFDLIIWKHTSSAEKGWIFVIYSWIFMIFRLFRGFSNKTFYQSSSQTRSILHKIPQRTLYMQSLRLIEQKWLCTKNWPKIGFYVG